MKFQDYYERLGVPRDSDAGTIKKAYRKLAMKYHPDRNQGPGENEAETQFKRINEAYEVLSDPDKRKRYDQFGEHWKQGQEFTPPPAGPGNSGGGRAVSAEEFAQIFGGEHGFSDFFASVFGDQLQDFVGRSARHHPRYRHRGADVKAELHLTLTQVVQGQQSAFEVPTSSPCQRCGGVGFLDQHVCPFCAGIGRTHGRKQVTLKNPQHMHDGMKLRLRGLGEPGEEGGETGDLHVTVRLESDDVYRKAGNDVEADVPIAPWEALSGAKVEVATLDGTLVVTIPPGTRSGARLRLRGKGLHDGQGGRGDLLLKVRVALPDGLSERQQELIREMAQAGPSRVVGGARVEGAP